MTIAHCPKCREQVSIPTGVSRQARVRCPLCSDEYLLDDALRPLPPLLVVVHDPEATTDATTIEPDDALPMFAGAETSRGPSATGNEPEQLSLEITAPPPPAFRFEPGSALAAGRSSRARSSAVAPRARRKQSSPLRLMVQTIGGGAMGLVIAQLILWWMPGKWDMNNRDPFKLAAKAALYAPFLVPAALHGSASSAVADSPLAAPVSDSAASTNSTTGDKSRGDSPPALDSQVPDFTFNANAPPQSAPPADVSEAAKNDQEVTKENLPIESVRLRHPPDIKIADITDRLADVVSADSEWDAAEKPTSQEKVRLITAIYDTLARLGEAVAVIGQDQPMAAEALQAVSDKLQSLVGQSGKMLPIGKLGGRSLSVDHDHGAVWHGTVLSHQARGRAFETTLRLHANNNPVVTVISSESLAAQLPVETSVLVLGRRVAEPAKNIVGYDGDAEPAMLYGTHAVVPVAAGQP